MKGLGPPGLTPSGGRPWLAELESTLPIHFAATMDTLISVSVGARSVILASLAVFAWVAVLLAAVGRWESLS